MAKWTMARELTASFSYRALIRRRGLELSLESLDEGLGIGERSAGGHELFARGLELWRCLPQLAVE
jgi:hypothetical protein